MVVNSILLNEIPCENFCILKLKEIRVSKGIICMKCNSTQYYWKNDKSMFECKICHSRKSLTSGTIMHRTKMPLHYWVVALNQILYNNKITVKEIQTTLNHNRYEPILDICNTIKLQLKRLKVEVSTKSEIEISNLITVSYNDLSIHFKNSILPCLNTDMDEKSLDEELIKLYLEWLSQEPQTYE
ncbi:hypothetical protein [uncultured Chryseobacterium sp.]|jgi:hypothetical protein|uniref:hypothetical protein n=1 Tax=uncultured Chryseobacterium sp. TaxID=259322 RepID=UPI00260D1E4D|nr:hypothetical protein [uncultured Chryseobacterium sp.]